MWRAWGLPWRRSVQREVAGERRGKHTAGGALGCSIHWWLSNQTGLESGVAWTGGVARLGVPWSSDAQRKGAGGGRGVFRLLVGPTLPLFVVFRKLIPLLDIFEVKIWGGNQYGLRL